AALVVANRAGLGARALRADLQRAARVNPYMRPATCTDLGEVDRRDFQGVARPGEQARADHDAGADRIFVRTRQLTLLDDRRLGGGAANVEGDDVLKLFRPRQRLRADHAGRRPGLDDVDRPYHRRSSGGEPTI